jgi:cytochrome o ubiquinol oxidase operon protein cyoD
MERSSSTLASYLLGFALSLLLTGVAYILVTRHVFEGSGLVAAIISLAIAQVIVQLFFFLHLGQETKPRWKLVVLGFMLVVLGILVFGSLWIMQHLDYNMSSHEMNTYIIKDEGIKQ